MDRRRLLATGASALTLPLLAECEKTPPPAPATATTPIPELPDVDAEGDTSVFDELTELAGQKSPGFSDDIATAAANRGELFTSSLDSAVWTAPPLTPELEELVRTKRYWAVPRAQRPPTAWPEDAHAPDYEHLSAFGAPSASDFDLTAATLAFLAERNAFVFTDKGPVRIFGLRGCALQNGVEEAAFAPSHRLTLQKPDHLSCRCLLGVWRRADDQLALYRASTAPAASNMFKSLQTRGGGTSLLPTGLYPYRAGPHKRAYPDRIQRGALLVDTTYAVLRTPEDLNYDPFQPNDVWTRGAAHNIHSAGVWSTPQAYDSSGCQVVRGKYLADRTNAEGPWASFRAAAGLVDATGAPIAEEPPGAGSYQYMLLTGLEAALHATGHAQFLETYHRLRPGSSGDAVRAHKARLKAKYPAMQVNTNGRFDMWTSFATLQEKKDGVGEYTSPIVIPRV